MKQEAPTNGMRGRLKHVRTEENVTTVDKLVGTLCQDDQTQTQHGRYPERRV